MNTDLPAPEESGEGKDAVVEGPRQRPRARWKMLVFLGVVGALAVTAEFVIPKMLMVAEVAEQERKKHEPVVIDEKDLPWTSQTVVIVEPADGGPVAVLSRAKRPLNGQPLPNAQSLLAHEVARQAILYGLRENFGLRTCDEALGGRHRRGRRWRGLW